MSQPLSEPELAAIAEAYPVGPAALALLDRAGFPRTHIPSVIGISSATFWLLANQEITAGVLENGRERILTIAAGHYPANSIFKTGRIRSVLLVGAAPDGLSPIRPDRDFAEAVRAVRNTGIAVDYRSSADVDDLDILGTDPPDLLHLACHGDGEFLVFENADGPRPVAVADLIAVLGGYAGLTGRRLRGVFLASCEGAAQAERFRAVADEVAAFAGELPEGCAPAFTAHLYRALAAAANLRGAAELASRTLTAARPSCRSLAGRLIILPAAS